MRMEKYRMVVKKEDIFKTEHIPRIWTSYQPSMRGSSLLRIPKIWASGQPSTRGSIKWPFLKYWTLVMNNLEEVSTDPSSNMVLVSHILLYVLIKNAKNQRVNQSFHYYNLIKENKQKYWLTLFWILTSCEASSRGMVHWAFIEYGTFLTHSQEQWSSNPYSNMVLKS